MEDYAFCFRSFRARAGQLATAHRARVISSGGMASLRMTGKPQSSRRIHSESSSAQIPWPAQAIMSTAIVVVFFPISPSPPAGMAGNSTGHGDDPRPEAGGAGPAPEVGLQVEGEGPQGAAQEPHRAVRVPAGSPPLDLAPPSGLGGRSFLSAFWP